MNPKVMNETHAMAGPPNYFSRLKSFIRDLSPTRWLICLRFSVPVFMPPSPLPAANSRRPFRFRQLVEIRCSLAPSELGSSAAVAEGGRWTGLPM